jgi:hypothetical protein
MLADPALTTVAADIRGPEAASVANIVANTTLRLSPLTLINYVYFAVSAYKINRASVMLLPCRRVHLTQESVPTAPRTLSVRLRVQLAALAGYGCVAVVFAWPLPLHLATALLGPISQDTGVYVWNLWVFRHEIVAHHHLPFATIEILSLAAPVPLALHNYTAIADLLAFPFLPWLGTVRTFNILLIASGVLSAFAMFLFARRATAHTGAAWLAGLLFGFSPYMSARTSEHFSLVQTAPIVLFALLFDRMRIAPTTGVAAAAGAMVSIAYLCDPYYAVYCVLIAAFTIAYSAVVVRDDVAPARPSGPVRFALGAIIAALVVVVAGIAVSGGGQFTILNARVSMTQLYTPVLLLTATVALRLWIAVRPRLSWAAANPLPPFRMMMASAIACAAVLAPVVLPVAVRTGERQWISPKVFWRSSAPGLDLFTLVTPNPLHPWFGRYFEGWLARLPHTAIENIASIPWTVIGIIAVAAWVRRAFAPRYWVAFTLFFGSLALGPFVHAAGQNLYVPTPWALLRYLPVIGAARMPTRMVAVVMFGVALLLAFAIRELSARVPRPALLTAGLSVLLLFELLPSPRPTYSAEVPEIYKTVAADPRQVAVLSLPFGLRDGLSSYGNANPTRQFFQTVHGKPIVGGYISRLPSSGIAYYTERQVTAALIDLSEGRSLTPERRVEVVRRAHAVLPDLNIGYVVINRSTTSDELIRFAQDAFDLEPIATEGARTLFRTPLARPVAADAAAQPRVTFFWP